MTWIECSSLSHSNHTKTKSLGYSLWWWVPEMLLGSSFISCSLKLRCLNSCHLGNFFNTGCWTPSLTRRILRCGTGIVCTVSSPPGGSYLVTWALVTWESLQDVSNRFQPPFCSQWSACLCQRWPCSAATIRAVALLFCPEPLSFSCP